jgi:recA bacterial DNA recombination protein
MTSTSTLRSLVESEHQYAFTTSGEQCDGAILAGPPSDIEIAGGTPRESSVEAWREQRLRLTRAQIEAQLSDRVAGAFARRPSADKPVLPTGISSVDGVLGGVPFSGITEIVGARWCSAGRATLLGQLLREATREFCCGLVDATDSFDPRSAEAAGVNLSSLLWIRCGGRGMKALEQAFKSADLLLQGSGGFGLLVVDLGGISEKFVRRVPLSTWFRFRAVVEKLSAPVVFITPQPVLGTCSCLTLLLSGGQLQWSQPSGESLTHARLPGAIDFQVQIAARRSFKKPSQAIRGFSAQRQWA